MHAVKPETCVAGPVTFDINPERGKIEWYLKMEKICPLAGVLHEDEEALSRHVESAKKECLALVQGLGAEELKAILRIEEPETFKIGEDDLDPKIVSELEKSVPKRGTKNL